jgi:hypothetical protein
MLSGPSLGSKLPLVIQQENSGKRTLRDLVRALSTLGLRLLLLDQMRMVETITPLLFVRGKGVHGCRLLISLQCHRSMDSFFL